MKGITKTHQAWTEWYHQRQEAKAQGYTLAEVPPAINEMADNHST